MIRRTFQCTKEDRELLEQVPFKERRPGIFIRRLYCQDYYLQEIKWACQDCCNDDERELDYMLRNELWKQICPTDGTLCIKCVEKRLGRSLQLNDLDLEVPMYQIFVRMMRGNQ